MQSIHGKKYDHDDCHETAVDVNLFKVIGMYKILQPSSKCESGNRYRTFVLVGLWLSFVLLCLESVRLCLAVKDFILFQYELMKHVNVMIGMFKGYSVVMNADILWDVLEAARYKFTSCGRQDPSILHQYRHSLKIWLRTFTMLFCSTGIAWVLAPWFINEYIMLPKLDGTVGYYRSSVYNLWYPVTDSTYNWLPFWIVTYMYEALMIVIIVNIFLLFDIFFFTMCAILAAQFQTLTAAYETLGQQNRRVQPLSRSLGKIFFIKTKSHVCLFFNFIFLLFITYTNI